MSYTSNWLNGVHENIQRRDAIESGKKEVNQAKNAQMVHAIESMKYAQRNNDPIGEAIARQKMMGSL